MSKELPKKIWTRDPENPRSTFRELQSETPDIVRTEIAGLVFDVSKDSTVPPSIETYKHGQTVSRAVREILTLPKTRKPLIIADIGTGSGIFAATVASELKTPEKGAPSEVRIVANDIAQQATLDAKKNFEENGVSEVLVFQGDCLAGIAPGTVDIIFSNPPYMPETMKTKRDKYTDGQKAFFPETAVIAGETGLEFYTKLFVESKKTLSPEGILVVQHEDFAKDTILEKMKATLGEDITVAELFGKRQTALVTGNPTWVNLIATVNQQQK